MLHTERQADAVLDEIRKEILPIAGAFEADELIDGEYLHAETFTDKIMKILAGKLQLL